MHKAGKWLTALLSISVATAAYAAPTAIAERPAAAVCTSRPTDYADTPAATPNVTEVAEAYNCHLANIAHELLKPPGDSIDSPVPAVAATSLPAVPGALFMGLTGFLCVSLVKDRRVWIAALTGLLWAGQAGFAALPQLAQHLASRKQTEQLAPANLTYTPELLHSDRLRSDIEGTRYITLLRYLQGIPANLRNTILDSRFSIPDEYRVPGIERPYNIRYTTYDIRHTTKSPQFALVPLFTQVLSATNRLAYITKWHAYFSPAFIFENLPRGPPCLA
jgi:hypothetical protein